MKVSCSNCNAVLNVADSEFVKTALLIECPNCQQRMRVSKSIVGETIPLLTSEVFSEKENESQNTSFVDIDIKVYLSTSDQFWKTFHESLSAPFSNWNNYKNSSLDEWISLCKNSPEFLEHLNILFEYPILKGEFLISFYSGFILTNYRLIINDTNSGKPSIPLNKIKSYNLNHDCAILFEKNNQLFSLHYQSLLNESIVNTIISRKEVDQLNDKQLHILNSSFYDLKKEYPETEFQPVNVIHSNVINNPIQSIGQLRVTPKGFFNELFSRKQIVGNIIIFILSLLSIFWVTDYRNEPVSISGNFLGVLFALILSLGIGWLFNRCNTINFVKTFKYISIGFMSLMLLIGKSNEGYVSPYSGTSSSSASEEVHHCTWCGKEYSGTGYFHIMNECVHPEKDIGIDVQCSQKCCMDSWNSKH
jgi:hypothetical protein